MYWEHRSSKSKIDGSNNEQSQLWENHCSLEKFPVSLVWFGFVTVFLFIYFIHNAKIQTPNKNKVKQDMEKNVH